MKNIHKNQNHGFATNFSTEEEKRFYRRWAKMKDRCTNVKNGSFVRYGAKNIKVCKEWLSFEGFKKDMFRSFMKHSKINGIANTTLDRIDNNLGYSKENCRWATYTEQRNNSSTAVIFNGETATQASLRLGGMRTLVYKRLKKGWSREKAFTLISRKS